MSSSDTGRHTQKFTTGDGTTEVFHRGGIIVPVPCWSRRVVGPPTVPTLSSDGPGRLGKDRVHQWRTHPWMTRPQRVVTEDPKLSFPPDPRVFGFTGGAVAGTGSRVRVSRFCGSYSSGPPEVMSSGNCRVLDSEDPGRTLGFDPRRVRILEVRESLRPGPHHTFQGPGSVGPNTRTSPSALLTRFPWVAGEGRS